MVGLPTGTVTFLFTDIEGSSTLLQRLGDRRYAEVLEEHQRILRDAFAKGNGQEIDSQGDSFLVAFSRARDAVATAVAAQQSLTEYPWPDGASLQVRMGLHTGEPISRTDRYVGLDVHRAARIGAAGYGGQILLSDAVSSLAGRDLPPGVSLRDLGNHRLKDLREPEHLLQVVHPNLPAAFPPLKSLNILPNNLPVQLTSFIGRGHEKAEVRKLLSTTRFITLTGSGGAGKTRLALQVAAEALEEFPDGVWLVELAALTNPSLVPKAVASALGIPEPEQPGRMLTETLADALRGKSVLVVLDNCEHLVPACAHLTTDLLGTCPNLRILATSREALGVTGETTWRVPSLSVPDLQRLPPLDHIAEYEAVRLFIDRAVTSAPQFAITRDNAPAVAQVCHRLDGIPLAIELAAARVKVLAVEQIAARLEDRFRLLTGGSRTALPRQQTLRAAMDWSYDLLSEQERTVLRRLSVFAGGWTLVAAEAVCSGDGVEASAILDLLAQLVDKSLVGVETKGNEARYGLLETVRQYGLDRLMESEKALIVRRKHRDWFLELVERAERELRGPRQILWLDRLENELDNLRAALEWSMKEAPAAGLRLAGELQWFCQIRGHLSEGRKWLEDTLLIASDASPPVRAKALWGVGQLSWPQGELELAGTVLRKSLTLWRELGDKRGMATALHTLGHVAENQADYGHANTHFEESLLLFRELGDKWGISWSLNCLGHVALTQGDDSRAKPLFEESLALCRETGDKWRTAYTLRNLGNVAGMRADYQRAMSSLDEGLALSRDVKDKYSIVACQNALGKIALKLGNHERAMTLFKESLTLRRDFADRRGIPECLEGLAGVAGGQAKPILAARLLGAAEIMRETIGTPLPPSDGAEYARQVSAAGAALGQEGLAAAWAEGRAMSLEQAIERALKET
ncbi:MAG TPA: tetratricopeptide repeat protein [bacterium]